jgi:CUB domain
VALTFVQFSTESCCDSVSLYDGFDSTSFRIASLAGFLSQTQYYSMQQYLFIRFTTDGSVTRSGFNATYQSVTPPTSTTPSYTTTTGEHCSRPFHTNCSSVSFCWLHIRKTNLAKLNHVGVLTGMCRSSQYPQSFR